VLHLRAGDGDVLHELSLHCFHNSMSVINKVSP